MPVDEQHVALPKLYGAPAYARPNPPVEEAPRPYDPDDLPIEAFQSPDERRFAESLPARMYAPGGAYLTGQQAAYRATPEPELRARPLSLKLLAGRILGNRES